MPGPYFDAQLRYASTFGKNKWAFKFTGEYTQVKDWPATDSINHYGAITAVDVNLNAALQQQAMATYCPTCPVTVAQHNMAAALTGWLAFNYRPVTSTHQKPSGLFAHCCTGICRNFFSR